jgi:hypothetical protein
MILAAMRCDSFDNATINLVCLLKPNDPPSPRKKLELGSKLTYFDLNIVLELSFQHRRGLGAVRGGEDFEGVRKESQFYPNKSYSPLKLQDFVQREEENQEDVCS